MTINIPENATLAGWEEDQSVDHSLGSTINRSGMNTGMSMPTSPPSPYYNNSLYPTGNVLRDLSALPQHLLCEIVDQQQC